MPTIKPTRVFTKEDPCTKVHLWNAFITPKGLSRITVVESRGEIGLNAPKYLRKKDLIIVAEEGGVEYYQLTTEGEDWLRKGLNRHLELHPADVENVHMLSLLRTPPRARRAVRKVA